MLFVRAVTLLLALASAGCPFLLLVGDMEPGPEPSGDGLPGVVAAACNSQGWCWERPATPGHNLYAIDGRTASDVWAVGEAGFVAHYNGSDWVLRTVEENVAWFAVHAVGPADVFLLGNELDADTSTVVRARGSVVEPVVISGVAPEWIFGSAADDLWAIADGRVYRWQDEKWHQSVDLVGPSTVRGWARAPDDVFVGTFTAGSPTWGSPMSCDLWHFSGVGWSQIWPVPGAPARSCAPLVGDVAPDGSLFVAGFAGISETGEYDLDVPAYVARYDGSDWRVWTLSEYDWPIDIAASDRDHALFSVAGSSTRQLDFDTWSETLEQRVTGAFLYEDAALLTGYGGTILSRDPDGQWRAALGSLHRGDIFDVWGSSAGDLWAVDQDGSVFHRTESAWTRDVSASEATGRRGRSIHGRSTDDIWVVGEHIVHRENGEWVRVEPPSANGANGIWTSLVVDDDGTAWLAGCGLFRRDVGSSVWTPVEADASVPTVAECGVDIADIFLGAGSDVYLRVSPSGMDLDDTRLFRYDGSAWTEVVFAANDDSGAIMVDACFDGDRLWVVSNTDGVYQESGDGFVNMFAPPPQLPYGTYDSIHAFGAGRVAVAGSNGSFATSEAGVWTREDTGFRSHVAAVWETDDARTLVGRGGKIVRQAR